MDWLAWGLTTGYALVVGVAAFFIKRSINKRDKEREAKDLKWENDQQELKKLILDELHRYHMENDGRFCKIETNVEKLDNKLRQTLEEMPRVYTLREDWMRSSASIDRKLDTINDNILNVLAPIVRGGKTANE